MSRPIKGSHAVVVGLFVLVVGAELPAVAQQVAHKVSGSTIKNHSISGKKLKTNTVTGKQIKESTLGTVPKAKSATKAGSATTAAVADEAKTLPSLTWHRITSLENDWADASTPSGYGSRPVSYAVDAQGFVHFEGVLANGDASEVAFTLPSDLLPPSGVTLYFPMMVSGGDIGELVVDSDGVTPGTGDLADNTAVSGYASLEGISYHP